MQVPLCPPQIPHGPTWHRTRASAVKRPVTDCLSLDTASCSLFVLQAAATNLAERLAGTHCRSDGKTHSYIQQVCELLAYVDTYCYIMDMNMHTDTRCFENCALINIQQRKIPWESDG